ncbi:YopX family protein [Lactiplantibacillus plantarum]|uniref:YopX family protein n=1 Tax=Lactiplantibacillus plantarum TaxID=1590 RepID=UPI0015F01B87|nr:YopX family protein [Lactiplantibacillus plantarum]
MIKFRGVPLEDVSGEDVSDIDGVDFDGTFVYGNYVKYGDGAIIVGDALEADEDIFWASWWVPVDPKTVEQFTVLKDANSQDIYEGDIIQYSHQFYEDLFTGAIGRETGYIGTVVKNNGAFGILINRMSYTDAHCNYYHAKDFVPFCEFDDPESDMALKGNVHENPELLEEDND